MAWKNFPQAQFRTIVVDPPWQFKDSQVRVGPSSELGFRYPVLSYEELFTLPVRAISEPQAHLYLWTPDALKEQGYSLMRAWGFEPKCELVWLKVTRSGKVFFGVGHFFRHAHETCLFGVCGKLPLLRKNLRTVFTGIYRGHSVKPDEFFKIVEQASPPPRVDLFARATRPGWTVWGNEV